jgi:hypothetical protein
MVVAILILAFFVVAFAWSTLWRIDDLEEQVKRLTSDDPNQVRK